MQATETFALGGTQVTTVIEIDLGSVWLISGNFSGTIPSGQTGFINGNVNLTGDLIVEGFLTGIDTFTLEGNGFQILAQSGGVINLQGVDKSGWLPWGDGPTGWLAGDAILSTPTAAGIFSFGGLGFTWNGTWPTRPANAPNVTLPNGQVAKPEVFNRTRSIVLQNLSRIHFHDDPGVQTLRYLSVLNSGITGQLAQYPIHFHHCGDSVRGSLLEGVYVGNGKNHAFVVHDSNGVTLKDCVAYNTTNDAYWWDPPIAIPPALLRDHTDNNSNDITYDHCLAAYVTPPPGDQGFRLTAFMMQAGSGNRCFDSVAVGVQGAPGVDASGFHWPEAANQNVGGNQWLFERNTAHNCKVDGIFVWQNDSNPHVIDDFVGYRNGSAQIDHGAYQNNYDFKRCVLMGSASDGGAFNLHAWGNILLEDVVANRPLRIRTHQSDATFFEIVRRSTFSQVSYQETSLSGIHSSLIRYEDCGFTPANFSMAGAVQSSIAEIYEGGVLTHRWNAGGWT